MNNTLTTLFVMPDAFHLGWMGATWRLFCLAKAFRELGFNVALLAGKMTDARVQTEIDREFPGLVVRTHHTGAYPYLLDVAALSRRACRVLWKVRGAEFYAARLSYGWAKALDVDNVISEFKSRMLNPNLLWGVSTGYLDGGTAADRLSNALGVPWIFELQDPPRGCGLGPDRMSIHTEFKRLLRTSARQVVTAESYCKKLLEEFTLNPETIRTIHLTYEGDLAEEAAYLQETKWRVVYAGSLQGGRSVGPLLYGLKKALACEPRLGECVSIEIAGIGLDETRKLANTLSFQQLVNIHGHLNREKTEELIKLARVLIIVQTAEASKLQVPGKVFEYMRLGKPILAIMPNCEAATILRRSGLGFIHPPEDIDGIADTLIRLWSDWRAGRSFVQMDRDYLSQFSVKHLPKKLRLVLEGLL